jgi:FtsH-binding integral membrane protein
LVLGLVLIGLSLLALYPGSIVWAYLDAKSRGKPGWALALFVALSPFFALIGWPLALLAWVVFRPEKLSAAKNIGSGVFDAPLGHA